MSFADQIRNDSALKRYCAEKQPVLAAQRIRKLYQEKTQGVMFPVIEFARKLNIEVISKTFPKDSKTLKGFLGLYADGENEPPRIVVSDSESYGHHRWTVAHELWHFLVHADDPRTDAKYYPEDSSSYDLRDDTGDLSPEDFEEVCANAFAAELLMPSQMFRLAYQMSSFMRTKELADMFLVSKRAIKLRARDLRL